jgi:two-component system, NtrC family, sensor kinase
MNKFASSSLRRLGLGFALVLALAVLGWLYEKTQAADVQQRAALEESFREIHQLDSDWNVDIMAAKVGLTESYDPIVAPLSRIQDVISRLHSDATLTRFGLASQLEALRGAFKSKAELVDEFKSRNSILRNSLRYLPTLAGEAKEGDTSLRRAGQPRAAQIDAVLQESLAYALITDDAQQSRLAQAAGELEGSLSDSPSESTDSRRTLLGHVRTVMTQVTAQSGLLDRILKVPTVQAIDAMSHATDARFSVLSAESEYWRKVLAGYAAVLLAAVTYTGFRLSQSYAQIGRMNRALRYANDGLERRVQERTRELGTALQSLRESEAQLIQSEKMSSLGQMVAGIAHEMNTPLAYVRSNIELVHDQLGEVSDLVRLAGAMLSALDAEDPQPDQLAQAYASLSALVASFSEYSIVEDLSRLTKDGVHGLDQIREIVVNLRNFSRLDRSRTTRFDVREGLDSALSIAKSELKRHSVEKRYGDVPKVFCSPSQLNQVFLNVIVNAAQALPESGGRIRVASSTEAEQVRVDISDDGCGIPPELVTKIFDPFFTTKEIGKGTGLGLSIAYKIIQEHGGRVAARSTVGKGTTFSIWLPINEGSSQ